MKRLGLVAAITLLMSPTAMAGIADEWVGKISASGSKTAGNTDTTDLGLALSLRKTGEDWRHKFNTSFDYGRNNDVDNKQRFYVNYQIDRNLNERVYSYGNANYFDDSFGPYREGYFIGGGLGYKVILPKPMSWDIEGGAGYRSQESHLPTGMVEAEVSLRAASNFDWKLNENMSINNDMEITKGDSDNYLWNETGITAKLMNNLAARASFRIDTHSDVPLGTDKTDTITRVGVVYTIR